MRRGYAGTFLFKFLSSGIENMKGEHLNGVYPILNVFVSFRAQPYHTASNHIAVIDAEFLLFFHRRQFWIIVKAASSECMEKKEAVNILFTVTTS